MIWQTSTGTNSNRFHPLVLHQVRSLFLTVFPTPGGSAVRSPDLPTYTTGSVVTVTATPDLGHAFIRWSGDATGSENPLTVSMDSSKSITAIFASLAVTVNLDGLGSVAKNPDREYYELGQPVTLTATPGRWRSFTGWADGNIDNPRVITVGESNAYTAIFTPTTPLETVTFGDVSRLAPVGMPAVLVDDAFVVAETVSVRGQASIALSTTFPSGTLLYTLDGSDPTFSARLYTQPFLVRKASRLRTIAYNAEFSQWVESDPLEIVVLPTMTGVSDGGGGVTIEPSTGAYFNNSMALVTATPSPGWTFLQWLGDATGRNPGVNLSMTRNKVARAMFGTTLNTTVIGAGTIVVDPASSHYPYGTEVRLTAVPAPGNYLAFWANAVSGIAHNPLTFTVTNANPTVTAVFANLGTIQTNTLTVIPDGQGQVIVTPPGTRFPRTTNVVLQAMPKPGQEFLNWLGDAEGHDNPLVVPMNTHKVITANFTYRPLLRGEGRAELMSQEGFRLTATGKFGAVYRVEGSDNFSDWSPLGMVTNEWGTVQFLDGATGGVRHRAYRTVDQP